MNKMRNVSCIESIIKSWRQFEFLYVERRPIICRRPTECRPAFIPIGLPGYNSSKLHAL